MRWKMQCSVTCFCRLWTTPSSSSSFWEGEPSRWEWGVDTGMVKSGKTPGRHWSVLESLDDAVLCSGPLPWWCWSMVLLTQYKTRNPAVTDKQLIICHCLEQPCSTLIMAIPDMEILAVCLLTVCFNVFARWHQWLLFKRLGVWGDMVGEGVESCTTVFQEGTS